MIWWFTSTRHDLSIKPWVRRWVGGTMLDRWLQMLVPATAWFALWMLIAASAVGGDSQRSGGLVLLIFGTLPWWLWIVDGIVDHYHVQGDVQKFLTADDVILATRAEYIGGHPQLPHGRFGYLLLEGTREDPNLTVGFPAPPGQAPDHFAMPVLDLTKTKPEKGDGGSQGPDMLATIAELSGKKMQRVGNIVLTVDYQGTSSRKHKVELTHFFHGDEEIRDWRNYLICAQAEADTGVTPYGPWKSLKPGFPTVEEVPSDYSRDGGERPPRRSAFARR